MARATYIYHTVDKKTAAERSFTVKWEMVDYVQGVCKSGDPNERFYCKRFRDGQDVEPSLFLLPSE